MLMLWEGSAEYSVIQPTLISPVLEHAMHSAASLPKKYPPPPPAGLIMCTNRLLRLSPSALDVLS